jgi:hypothetical protein
MSNITTLNQIISWFRQYSEQHPLLRDFGYGATDMIGSTKAMQFPYLWIASTNNNPITISNHVVQPEFEFLVMVVDALSDQTQTDPDNGYIATNEQDVLSDTYQIVQDFVAWLNTSWRPTGITIDANLNAQPVTDTTPDRVSGWAITITMKVPYRTCVSGIDIVAPEIYTSLTTQNAVTASYAITAGTASYFSGSISNAVNATNAISASWAATASYFSGSIANATNAISASYALTASYALNGGGGAIDTSSFITAAQTASMTVLSASYAAAALSASWAPMPEAINTSSFITAAQTASMTVLSSSYAVTASYALNAPTIDTGSFLTTSSFNTFTSSYYAASASFSASIAELFVSMSLITGSAGTGSIAIDTSSFVTTSSFAAFTSSYYIDSASIVTQFASASKKTLFHEIEYGTITSQSGNWRTVTSASALLMQYWDALGNQWVTDTKFTGTPYSGSGGAVASSSYAATSSYSDYALSASNALTAVTASHLLGTSSAALSSSYSATSSYIDPAFISASAAAAGFGSGGGGGTSGSASVVGPVILRRSLVFGIASGTYRVIDWNFVDSGSLASINLSNASGVITNTDSVAHTYMISVESGAQTQGSGLAHSELYVTRNGGTNGTNVLAFAPSMQFLNSTYGASDFRHEAVTFTCTLQPGDNIRATHYVTTISGNWRLSGEGGPYIDGYSTNMKITKLA